MKTIAFFNNKGGVGKTTLVYHLAWMFAERGINTLAVDLDPQANLSAMFLKEEQLEELWPEGGHPRTILGCVQPIMRGTGDIAEPYVQRLSDNLGLLTGDLGLSRFEDKLSAAWPACHNSDEAAFRTMTAFHRSMLNASSFGPELILIDVGPNLGAINRSALIASDQVVIPMAPDLFSLQGLKNLGPTLREWRGVWAELKAKAPSDLDLPNGLMEPAGYIVMQHGMRDNRPVKAYSRWLNKIPSVYRDVVLDKPVEEGMEVAQDPLNLALLKHYRSLMPLAMSASKPMFQLKPSDGAIGAHVEAVRNCESDFLALAKRIGNTAGITVE